MENSEQGHSLCRNVEVSGPQLLGLSAVEHPVMLA